MAKKTNSKKKTEAKKYVTWGAGIGALAAGAAGAYFLYGAKEGPKRRKKIKSWALKMKADVMKKLENLKEVNEEVYNKVIDEVASQYKKAKSIDPEEVAVLVSEMKRYWKNIKKDIEPKPKKRSASRKKSPAKKKTAKRSTKKTATKKSKKTS